MTLCQFLLDKARRLPPTLVMGLTLLCLATTPFATAQGLTDDPDLRRLRDGASRLRELGWGGATSDGGAKGPAEPAASVNQPPAEPLPQDQPIESMILPRPSATVNMTETRPTPVESFATADAWQALLWRQDTLSERVDAETGELTRRLLALEERIAQLSAIFSWFSGATILLLVMVGTIALRLRRRLADTPADQEEPIPPPEPYLSLPALSRDDRLAACELLLLSGHYRQCLQQSRDAAIDATMAELPLFYFFEAAARRLLGEDDGLCEERLRASVKRTRLCDWPLNDINSWLLLADMPEKDRTYLDDLMACLRPWDAAATKENPSGVGGVFDG
jgi:hypothetical protein